ncbi:MAG: putative DNA-binding domain-containing protein [Methylococcales bacterium]
MQLPPVISTINDALPEFQQYQHRFVDYIRNPLKDGAVPGLLPVKSNIYAKLLFSKIEGSLDNCFPISCQLLGSECWQQLIKNFISEHQCKSPLYREIPDEFIDYLMNDQSDIVLPEFIIELAHFEWMELVLETEKAMPSKPCFPMTDNILDITPMLNPVLHLLYYHYPVQNISSSNPYWKNWESRSKPYSQDVIILAGLRDNNDKVQFIEINRVTAHLIELAQEELSSGKQLLLELAAAMHYGDHETILPFGTDILKQLEQQHIIIGSLNK